MKRFLKGIVLVMVVCSVILAPLTVVHAGEKDIPRTFNVAPQEIFIK